MSATPSAKPGTNAKSLPVRVRRALEGRRRQVAGVAAVVVVALVATLATSSASEVSGPGRSLTLYADSTDVGALIKGNDVRMYGVKIGIVKDMTVVHNNEARLTLDLTTTDTPIHTDATLQIRPVSLLGERYVDLTPGSANAPVAKDDYTLPPSQVSRAVDLDEVLDTVNQPTGTALSMLLQTLGDGLQGNGQNAADAITNLGPSMGQANQLVSVLDNQTATLKQLIDALRPVMAAIGINNGATTDSLINSAGSLLSATSQQEASLRLTLAQLPSTLVTAEHTLARLSGLSDEATPALASVRPFTNKLSQISNEAINFSDAAAPAIATLKPVLTKARTLVEQAQPLVAQLNSSRTAMEHDAANGSRFLDNLSDHLGGLLDFITYWSLTTNGQDGLSHYFRVQLTVQGDTLTSQLPGPLTSPARSGTKKTGSKNPVTGALGGLAGGLGNTVKGTLKGVGGTVGGLTNGLTNGLTGSLKRHDPNADSATGLTVSQESKLLGLLMGGQ